jgi:hypothetical protein
MWYYATRYFVINVEVFYFMTLKARRIWCSGQALFTFSIALRFLRQNFWKFGPFPLSSVRKLLVCGLSSYKYYIQLFE